MSSEIRMLAAALSGLERIQKLEISKAPETRSVVHSMRPCSIASAAKAASLTSAAVTCEFTSSLSKIVQ
jgi:hypothetical protein